MIMDIKKQADIEQETFIRNIDNWGRLVLPFQIRKALHIDENKNLKITVKGSCITIDVG